MRDGRTARSPRGLLRGRAVAEERVDESFRKVGVSFRKVGVGVQPVGAGGPRAAIAGSPVGVAVPRVHVAIHIAVVLVQRARVTVPPRDDTGHADGATGPYIFVSVPGVAITVP
jgi:hypothetical protein